jgi:prepilin-type processing-associated H-X9-DG protein
MNRQNRTGFSLIELLIVFALLAFLIGLLLPLIQRVRLEAARMQSQNNLRQLALACHNYHDAFNKLPPGVDANGYSAAAYLLPFIEQQPLFQQINFKMPVRAQANDQIRSMQVAVFLSPLDPVSTQKIKTAPTSYLFSAGTGFSLADNNGIFFKESQIKFTDITDGTANTLMIGETLIGDGSKQAKDVKRQHVELGPAALKTVNDKSGVQEFANDKKIAGDRCHSWLEGKFLQGTFTGTRTVNDTKPDVDCGGLGGLSGLRTLERTVNVAFADGHVRAVSVSVSLASWQAACTRAANDMVGNDL